MEEVKSFRRARVCLTNPLLILLLFVFLADIAMRRFAYVPPMPHWTKPAKKAIMTKEKTAEDGQPEPEAEKPKEKTKKAKPEETASQALDTSALIKEKRKAEPFRLKENRSHYAIRQQFTRNVTEYRS